MNVATITMPKGEAKRRLKEYRTGLHRRADAEYEACEAAYQEVAAGRPLLNLTEAMRVAPRDAKGRPMIAIARADRLQVHVQWDGLTRCLFDARRNRSGAPSASLLISVGITRDAGGWSDGYALVPMVPPAVKKHHALAGCHVLWEVEAWADRPIRALPDRDPYLLRHIGGDLYAVLGEWELTEIERAVMAGRAQS
jgi:hypothetical protein